MAMEPTTIIATISASVKLLAEIRNFFRKENRSENKSDVKVEPASDLITIASKNAATTIVESDIIFNRWDQIRAKALRHRLSINWGIYNETFGRIPLVSFDEQARLHARLDDLKASLMNDYEELLSICDASARGKLAPLLGMNGLKDE